MSRLTLCFNNVDVCAYASMHVRAHMHNRTSALVFESAMHVHFMLHIAAVPTYHYPPSYMSGSILIPEDAVISLHGATIHHATWCSSTNTFSLRREGTTVQGHRPCQGGQGNTSEGRKGFLRTSSTAVRGLKPCLAPAAACLTASGGCGGWGIGT